ncbi:hypothetical protein CWI80_07000 [Pseudidiomarina sediminum]|uniref:YdbS-like PH domain-containing protein n=1 Tax=Pseudidiomarina sediminum TaxID=431675 RepID=A0A432ZAT0_9GAMM|nr:PH domain-containing protein [Pseudidiomarina sediminum]RUO75067.1 hypothetical protein CWI80_07000 [Pseudidiomarina sediminum]
MSELAWQRTPLLTMAFFFFRQIKQLVTNLSNLLPAFLGIFVAVKNNIWLLYIFIGGYVVFIIINAILQQRFYWYAIADDAVHVKTGVLNRQHLTLKYERIQQAEIHQTWYFRPFGLTLLNVDSAGSAGKEVMIPGLSLERAHYLRQQMLETQTQAPQTSGAPTTPAEEPGFRQHFSTAEIIRAGIIDNKLFVLLALLLYPAGQFDVFDNYIEPWLDQHLSWFSQDTAWLLVVLIFVVPILVLFILAIVVSLVLFHDLTVTIEGDRFQARSGAFTIRTLSFRYPKLQAVRIRRNLRARLLNRSVLKVSQLQPRQSAGQPSAQQFMLPVVAPALLATLREYLRLPNATDVHWQRLSTLALLKPSLWVAVLTPGALAFAYFALELEQYSFIFAGGLWLVLQVYFTLRWYNYRYTFASTSREQWFAVRRGVIGRSENWYPRHKIQQIDVVQGPWLRMLGFHHLILHTAAGSETIKYLPSEKALELQRDWTHAIASSHRRWM